MTFWRECEALPPTLGENIMADRKTPEQLELLMHDVHVGEAILARERELQAWDRARDRVMRRDDVASCHIRPDGTLECTGYDGSVTLRPAGWRGRA